MSAYSDAILADSPYLYWRLGEPSSSTAVDASGNGHAGTYVGSPSQGVSGLLTGDTDKAVMCDVISGSPGSYGRTTGTLGATSYATFSFEMLINLPADATYAALFTLEGFANGGSGLYFYGVDGGWALIWDSNGLDNKIGNNSGPFVPDGFVHHVAGVYDGTNALIYVDGSAIAGAMLADPMLLSSARRLFLGQDPSVFGGAPMSVYMDEAAFYDRDLTPTEISNHVAAMTGGGYEAAIMASAPTAYFRLGEPSGSVMADSSGNGFNGVYVNGPTLAVAGSSDDGDTAVTFQVLDPRLRQTVVQTDQIPSGLYPNFSIECIFSSPLLSGFGMLAGVDSNVNTDFLALLVDMGTGQVTFGADSILSGFSTGTDGTPLVANQAYHVVGTWDGTNCILYINGVVVASSTSAEIIELVTPENFYAGSDLFYDQFVGTLDEVAFYTTTLSPARVLAHYEIMSGGTSSAPSYEEEVLADGPVIYWRCGDPTGTTAVDDSGNGHDGTYVNSPTLGTSGLLDGNADTAITVSRPSNQYIVQSDTIPSGAFPNFSIETIVVCASGVLSFPSIAGFNGDNFDMMMLALNDNGGGGFVNFAANSSTSGWQVTSVAGGIENGTRYHIVGTWDGTTARIYVNGTGVASGTSSEVIELGQPENLYAGSDQFGNAFDGVVDEVAFYDVTLSPTRITAHYAALLAGGGGVIPPGPNVTHISVASGPISGGTVINITGTHLGTVTAVKFGTTNATSFTINSTTSITATSPAHSAGLVDITVISPDGTSGPSTADHFVFISIPSVSSVSPNTGSGVGGYTVTLTGTQFTGATSVLFGVTSAGFTVVNDTTITVTAPGHVDALVNVRVTTPAGISTTGTGNRFTYGTGGGGGGGGGSGSSMTVVRWTFLDTSDSSTATFEMNPGAGGTPGRTRRTSQNRLADSVRVLVYANSEDAATLEFSGTILTQGFYELLLAWFNKTNPVEIHDDLGRVYTVVFTKYDAKREWKANVPWYHTYDATATVLGVS